MAHCGFMKCNVPLEDLPQNINIDVIPAIKGYKDYAIKSYVWGKLFRKDLLDGIWFNPDIKMAEDKLFTLQVISKSRYIAIVNNNLYYYYQHNDSSIHKFGQCMFPVGRELFNLAMSNNNKYLLCEAYTTLLAHRYLNMFNPNHASVNYMVNRELEKCRRLAKEIMPMKDRILLNIMVEFPLIYRFLRIVNDRTMLDWEREQKKKMKMSTAEV